MKDRVAKGVKDNKEMKTDLEVGKVEKRRLEEEVSSLKSELSLVKSQLSDHAFNHIEEKASTFTKEMFNRLSKKIKTDNITEMYSKDMRAFSITLHGYSARAYRYNIHGNSCLK